jgi:hypothetical protein
VPAVALAALTSLVVSACGGPISLPHSDQPEEEEPGTWGHLAHGRYSWLVQLPPRAVVGVCADDGIDFVTALSAWAKAIGRDGSLSFLRTCDDTSVSRTVTVMDTRHPDAQTACDEMGDVGGFAVVGTDTVVICEPKHAVPIALHEAGHLWGMCDVYPSDDPLADNCDPAWFTGRNEHSVMGANYQRHLASADVEGIQLLAGRSDVAGNAAWGAPAAALPPSSSFAAPILSLDDASALLVDGNGARLTPTLLAAIAAARAELRAQR